MSPKQMHVTGVREVQANVNRILNGNLKDAKKALLIEANMIGDEAVKQAPVEFGDLRRSETVEVTKNTKTEYEVTVGFNTTYAAAVHENRNAHHNVGKAKYLEDPLMKAAPGLGKRVAKRVKAGMRI